MGGRKRECISFTLFYLLLSSIPHLFPSQPPPLTSCSPPVPGQWINMNPILPALLCIPWMETVFRNIKYYPAKGPANDGLDGNTMTTIDRAGRPTVRWNKLVSASEPLIWNILWSVMYCMLRYNQEPKPFIISIEQTFYLLKDYEAVSMVTQIRALQQIRYLPI